MIRYFCLDFFLSRRHLIRHQTRLIILNIKKRLIFIHPISKVSEFSRYNARKILMHQFKRTIELIIAFYADWIRLFNPKLHQNIENLPELTRTGPIREIRQFHRRLLFFIFTKLNRYKMKSKLITMMISWKNIFFGFHSKYEFPSSAILRSLITPSS
jgi:hypothetical protein